MSRMLFKSHAMYALYTVVKLSRQVGSYTWSVILPCCDVSPVFRLFQAVGEKWLSTTCGLRNIGGSFMLFLTEAIFNSQDTSEIQVSSISVLLNS